MLKKAVVCLHLGSIFTLVLAAFLAYLAFIDKQVDTSGIIIIDIACIVSVVWYEVTCSGLKKLRPWAWKSSVVIFGLFIPSLYIIVGIVGMQSVTSNTMREQIFGEKDTGDQANAKSFADIMNNEKHIKNDKSIDEYIASNDALQRYMNYKKDN